MATPRFIREFAAFRERLDLFRPRRKFDIVYQNFAFVGLLCLWQVYYESNFLLIPFLHLSIVAVTTDLLITACFLRFFQEHFSIAWALIHNLVFGFVVCFLLVWTNDEFASSPVTEVLPVEHWETENYAENKRSKTGIALTVNIKGMSHRMLYAESATTDALRAGQVSVTLRKGLWGYWVLDDVELIDAE